MARFVSEISFLALFVAFNGIAFGEDGVPNPADSPKPVGDPYILFLGVDGDQKHLVVKDQSNTKISRGSLQSGYAWRPSVSVATPNKYFSDSNHFGYYFYGDLTDGYVNQQNDTNVATNVDGTFPRIHFLQVAAGAALFASIGDKLVANPNDGMQLKLGIGLGPGYTSIRGTVPAQFMTTGVAESINAKGFGLSFNFFIRATCYGWFLEAGGTGITINKKARSYEVSDSQMTLGYSFPFNL